MKEQEILVPTTSNFAIKERKYILGKVSLRQAILFGKFITENIITSRAKLMQLQEKANKSNSNAQDLMDIISLLEEKEAYHLFGILLNEPDIEFIERNLGLEDGMEILALICEHNNFESIKKKFLRIISVFNKEEPKTK